MHIVFIMQCTLQVQQKRICNGHKYQAVVSWLPYCSIAYSCLNQQNSRNSFFCVVSVSLLALITLVCPFQRRGPQRSVDVIVSAGFYCTIILVCLMSIQVRHLQLLWWLLCLLDELLWQHLTMFVLIMIIFCDGCVVVVGNKRGLLQVLLAER